MFSFSKHIILFGVVFLSLTLVKAQDSTKTIRFKAITITPQLFFSVNNYGINYEWQIKHNHDIEFTAGYINSRSYTNQSYHTYISGFQLEAFHKIYLSSLYDLDRGLYVAYGALYGHYDIDHSYFSFNHLNYGATYHERTIINAMALKSVIGIQKIFFKRLIIDYYLGVGIRKSFRETTENGYFFNGTMQSFGYTGNTLHLGIKIGYKINKCTER